MADKSGIEWLSRTLPDGTKSLGASWNFIVGCSHASAGCEHCYAETLARRYGWSAKPWTAINAAENIVIKPEKFFLPLQWQRPRSIFVNSLSDLFHPLVPFEIVDEAYAVMALAPQHVYFILSKRVERMLEWYQSNPYPRILKAAEKYRARRPKLGDIPISDPVKFPWPHVWPGTSVENQKMADLRLPIYLQVPSAVYWISGEPLLESMDISAYLAHHWYKQSKPRSHGESYEVARIRHGIDWVVVGGESGPSARPFNPDWARSLRDQCQRVGVRYFFKQHGGRTPKAGGRMLDGRTWDEMPPFPPLPPNIQRALEAKSVKQATLDMV